MLERILQKYPRWSGKGYLVRCLDGLSHPGRPSGVDFPMELMEECLANVFSWLSNSMAIHSNLDWNSPPRVERRLDPGCEEFIPAATTLIKTNHTARNRISLGPEGRPREAMMDKNPSFPGRGPLLLYAGRLSEGKGLMVFPGIYYRQVKAQIPDARLAFAGTGPCMDTLSAVCPDAIFLGWVDSERLAQAYSAADLQLPSWFDTFSASLPEALNRGLPALAFDTKGPRDILAGEGGCLLAGTPAQMADLTARLSRSPERMRVLKARTLERADDSRPGAILGGMLRDPAWRKAKRTPRRAGSSHSAVPPRRGRGVRRSAYPCRTPLEPHGLLTPERRFLA
jgi:glycosyltransferase involved in cell wall biosynthesis